MSLKEIQALFDNELMMSLLDAQEEQDGRKIKAIRQEMNRRNCEL
jgi:hypothetical protein